MHRRPIHIHALATQWHYNIIYMNLPSSHGVSLYTQHIASFLIGMQSLNIRKGGYGHQAIDGKGLRAMLLYTCWLTQCVSSIYGISTHLYESMEKKDW